MTKDYPWGKGTPVWIRDASLNDSDKSYTVPAGKIWKLIMLEGQLATSATVGNRYLAISISNGTNEVFKANHTAAIAASQYGMNMVSTNAQRDTTAKKRLDDATTDQNVTVQSILPEMSIPAGYIIRIWDVAAIDAAADDLTVNLHYIEYDA